MNLARKRLTRKLLVILLAPTLVCIALAAAALGRGWEHLLREDADRELADHVALLRATLPPLKARRDVDLAAVADAITDTQVVLGVAMYDRRGHAIGHSRLLAKSPARVDAIARGVLESAGSYHARETLGGEDALIRAEHIDGPSEIAVVVVSHSLEPVRQIVREGFMALVLIGGLLIVAVGVVAVGLARSLGGGVGDLIHFAEQVSAGDLRAKVELPRTFELDSVGGAFNSMARALAEAQAEIERAIAVRRELTRRIQHAQALTVVGQVSASFAHEIGSPLSTILGWARVASADDALPERTRKQFDIIAQQCERITRIVQRMLATARPSNQVREPVDVGGVARDVIAFVEPDCRARRIEVSVDVTPDAPRVTASRDELLQLVLNLTMNAIQAQPSGGRLAMSLRRGVLEDRVPPRPSLVFELCDAGPGVPPDLRDRLFEPFYSTKRPEGGTGLGLAIVADIVRELRGRISVTDAEGGGAVFRVQLPVDDDAGALGA